MDLGGSLPACLERDGLSQAVRLRKESRGKRGQTRRTMWLQKSLAFTARRGSDARGVPVRRNRFVAEVVRQRWTQRSVRTPFHPIWVAHRDGGLVRRQQASAKSAAQHLRMNGR